ncbi:hypothetical protein [Azospirillum sp.]|uniref:hypothetical protein n=1 Tax=Azospirillum sp. TaxID=34012 RepID=UPI003D73C4A5
MRVLSRTAGGVLFLSLFGVAAPASASDGAAPANTCPYDMAVTVALGRQSLTIPQSALLEGGDVIDGYELRPDHSRLVLEIVGRRGEVWHAPMTKLVRGKRCQGIFLGRPVQEAARSD